MSERFVWIDFFDSNDRHRSFRRSKFLSKLMVLLFAVEQKTTHELYVDLIKEATQIISQTPASVEFLNQYPIARTISIKQISYLLSKNRRKFKKASCYEPFIIYVIFRRLAAHGMIKETKKIASSCLRYQERSKTPLSFSLDKTPDILHDMAKSPSVKSKWDKSNMIKYYTQILKVIDPALGQCINDLFEGRNIEAINIAALPRTPIVTDGRNTPNLTDIPAI